MIPEGWSIEAADFINKVRSIPFTNAVAVVTAEAWQPARLEWCSRAKAARLDARL